MSKRTAFNKFREFLELCYRTVPNNLANPIRRKWFESRGMLKV